MTLTTTGYGDFYPVSAWGRFIAGVFMLLCMVTLSLPISVVRAGEREQTGNRRGGEEGLPGAATKG